MPGVVVKTEYVKQAIPASLLNCQLPPITGFSTNAEAQEWTKAMHREAYACQAKIEAIKGILK